MEISNIAEINPTHIACLLERLQRLDRGPKGLANSWWAAQQAVEGSIERVLLEKGGFAVWFAHLIVKTDVGKSSRFAGKTASRKLLAELGSQTTEYLGLLATVVASSIDPAIKAKVEQVYQTRIKSSINDITQQSTKRPRLDDNYSILATSPTLTPGNVSSITARFDYSQGQNVHDPNHFAEDKHVLVNASLLEATELFPTYISDAIKRVPHPDRDNTFVAAISMTFPRAPYTDKFGCQMALSILENKVESLAQEFFDVRLQTTGGLRYMLLSGGAKILPNPKFTLQGCQFQAIPRVFGAQVTCAITASPAYQDDTQRVKKCTQSVSMVVSHLACEGAVVYASLGLWDGTQIKKKLYG
ncbi:hypothetical protein F5B19DRAFT_498544 [Rostrohypoxylon terebratum]|nr:hypothetical protein F5B19DRAFT_498544 [Rostrohypoxylon terebratum]